MMQRIYVAIGVGLLLVGCATAPTKETNVRLMSSPWQNAKQMVLECDGSVVLNTACRFGLEGGGKPVEKKTSALFDTLSPRHQYLKRLIALSATDAVKNPKKQREAPVSDADVSVLQGVANNQDACLADREYTDFLVACPVPNANAVVLFFRGLCDRCVFEPTVLRR